MRIGLVGYGFGGRNFHAPIIAGAPGCTLADVVTAPRTAGSSWLTTTPASWPTTPSTVAAGVDAVTVCTPAATHTAVTEDLPHRGLPVVCDKPFALDARAARGTVELAERAGVLVSPYQNRP